MKLPRKKEKELENRGYRPPRQPAGGGAEARRELEELERRKPDGEEEELTQEEGSDSQSDGE